MLSNKCIFFSAVILAVLIVVLLALVSPVPHRKQAKATTKPWLALSLYIQQVQVTGSNMHPVAQTDAGALIFHRALTEGPLNTSRVVGKAQGFIIPIEHFAHSGFNIIYLTFNTREYSGSVSIQAKNIGRGEKDELTVVGGTGSFAFARGLAAFARTGDGQEDSDSNERYRIRLHLKFPNRSQTIPG